VKTVAWWHCFAGIAGNMALGALIDAGADMNLIERELVALPVGGWSLETEPVLRAEARLPDRARSRALAVFEKLGQAESQLHRRPLSQVHFHEVGSTDAIIDIIGTCVALELLGVDEVRSSPVAQGTGMVTTSHGVMPVPAPAVVKLLTEAQAPTYGTAIPMELTTPTGAAILAALCSGWGPMPPLTVTATGFGAGSREIEGLPNATQVIIGQAAEDGSEEGSQPVIVLEASVDDVTGEILGTTLAALMGAGALDAWVSPVTGKKGRPAHVVSVLCDESKVGALRQVLSDETGTLGVRASTWRRWPATREFSSVEVGGYPVRVKRGPRRIKAEHDDATRVARLIGLPVREVARQAEDAAHRMFDDPE
jgi:pyridinium-3,5-bisthiocarboxylic acid mononucleotide nickel chelatase